MDGSSWPLLQLPPNISQLVQRYKGQLNEGQGTDEGGTRAIAVDLSVGKDDRDIFTCISNYKMSSPPVPLYCEGEFPCNETFGPPRRAVEVVARKLSEGKSNGYMQSHGEWHTTCIVSVCACVRACECCEVFRVRIGALSLLALPLARCSVHYLFWHKMCTS